MKQKTKIYILLILFATVFTPLNLGNDNVKASWFDNDYNNYVPITINHNFVDNDLTDFPILVNISDTVGIGDFCNDGNSIRFLNPDNTTEYYYEIENWQFNKDRLIWVKIPFISSTVNTTFLMYYNNPSASDNQTAHMVWDSNYIAVWHMTNLLDSTNNNIDLTNVGADSVSTGKIGDCYQFKKIHSDEMSHNTFLDTFPTNNKLTIEIWANHTSTTGSTEYYLSKNNIIGQDRIGCGRASTGYSIQIAEGTNGGTKSCVGNKIQPNNNWNYSVFLGEKNIALKNVLDGYITTTGSTVTTTIRGGTATNFRIGNWYTGSFMDGYLDEIRVSDIRRNDTWINVSYHTQNETIDFLTWGNIQTLTIINLIINNETPLNNTQNIQLFPVLNVYIAHPNNSLMNIQWYSNYSGMWQNIGEHHTNVTNRTYYQKFNELGIYNKTYYWYAKVTYDQYFNLSKTVCFTSEPKPTTTTNNNGEIGLLGIFGFLGFLMYKKLKNKS